MRLVEGLYKLGTAVRIDVMVSCMNGGGDERGLTGDGYAIGMESMMALRFGTTVTAMFSAA